MCEDHCILEVQAPSSDRMDTLPMRRVMLPAAYCSLPAAESTTGGDDAQLRVRMAGTAARAIAQCRLRQRATPLAPPRMAAAARSATYGAS